MALTDIAIRNAKPTGKAYKLSDAYGLYLLVGPTGSRRWRYDYVFAGKRKTLALGSYPEVSLSDARKARDKAKHSISEGDDPLVQKKLAKIAAEVGRENSFSAISKEFLERLKDRQPPLSETTLDKKRWILEDIVCPEIGTRPVSEIKPAEVLVILQRLERAGKKETARRTRSTVSAVFRYAITTLRAEHDPTLVLRDAIMPPKVTHYAAIIDEREFGRLMVSIDEYNGGWITLKLALQFIAYTFCRPGEVRMAKWSEFDLAAKVWTIPAERMKMRRIHQVPLSKQVMAILSHLRELDPRSELVFPSLRTNKKPLSENAMNSALRRMGYTQEEMTSHGFRSSASSILNGRKYDAALIEYQLSHLDEDTIRRIYNRAQFWEDRVNLMQRWANIVDTLKLI
ncbi:integrase arm-type DNA-binding domain-containing protein [Ochrobactrum sp. GPK 3]